MVAGAAVPSLAATRGAHPLWLELRSRPLHVSFHVASDHAAHSWHLGLLPRFGGGVAL